MKKRTWIVLISGFLVIVIAAGIFFYLNHKQEEQAWPIGEESVHSVPFISF